MWIMKSHEVNEGYEGSGIAEDEEQVGWYTFPSLPHVLSLTL